MKTLSQVKTTEEADSRPHSRLGSALSTREALETQPRLQGRCRTLTDLNTRSILSSLGNGDSLPVPVSQEMGQRLNANFEDVRVHTGRVADRLNDSLGTTAFTIGRHIAFSGDSYQPFSGSGRELLGHELVHTIKAPSTPANVLAWQTRYSGITYRTPHEGGFTHEDLAEGVMQTINSRFTTFGDRAREMIVYWVAELDRIKGRPQEVIRRFPEIAQFHERISEARRRRNQAVYDLESLLHSYGGVPSEDIGIQFPGQGNEANTGSLTGGGIIGELLQQAIRNFNNRYSEHALRLLGISLHTVQDFYSHHTPLAEREEAVRQHRDYSVLEDDPSVGPWRWDAARERSTEVLRLFYQQLSSDGRACLGSPSLTWPPAQRDAGTFGVHGVPVR